MGFKSKPGDGIFGKGLRGNAPQFRELFEGKSDVPEQQHLTTFQMVQRKLRPLKPKASA